jgi:uncharacterized membrane protein
MKLRAWVKKLKIAVIFPYMLLIFGFTGLAASVVINVEKSELIQHPKAELLCNLNPLYSCSNVITSKHSKTLGISNEVYGLGLFGGIIAVGLMTLAGARPKKWFWQAFLAFMGLFMLTILYLWYQSIFVIGSICIFCTTVWLSAWTITMVLYTWAYDQKALSKLPKSLQPALAFKRKYAVYIWGGMILLFALIVVKHFWYFYGPHLGF